MGSTDSSVRVEGSEIFDNDDGGILLSSPAEGSVVVNSVINNNGTVEDQHTNTFGGIKINDGGYLDVVHSTFFGNKAFPGATDSSNGNYLMGDPHSVFCAEAARLRLYYNVFYGNDKVSDQPAVRIVSGDCDGVISANNYVQRHELWGDTEYPDETLSGSGNIVSPDSPLLDSVTPRPLPDSPLKNHNPYPDGLDDIIRAETGLFFSPKLCAWPH